MDLYHASCPKWDKNTGPVPRLRLDSRNIELATRTYKCDRCGDTIHADMDWPEDIEVEPDGRID